VADTNDAKLCSSFQIVFNIKTFEKTYLTLKYQIRVFKNDSLVFNKNSYADKNLVNNH